MGKLAGAACLLLVPVIAVGLPGNGFAIGDNEFALPDFYLKNFFESLLDKVYLVFTVGLD